MKAAAAVAYAPSQKHVADAGLRIVEDGWRPRALDDLEVQRVEDRADELPLGARNETPQQMARLDDLEPLGPRLDRV